MISFKTEWLAVLGKERMGNEERSKSSGFSRVVFLSCARVGISPRPDDLAALFVSREVTWMP